MQRRVRVQGLMALVALLAVAPGAAQSGSGEWPAYGGSNASTKYSALDQINSSTVKDLRIVWRQSATPVEIGRGVAAPPG